VLILLFVNSTIFGQTQSEEDGNNVYIPVEIYLESNDNAIEEGENEVNVKSLIQEYAEIMAIPKDERTVEQWDRTNEILFLIYFNADLRIAFEELAGQIDTYNQLIDRMMAIIEDLEELYKKELETYNALLKIQENLTSIYENYSGLGNKYSFHMFFSAGYTINLGLNLGAGFIIPITERIFIGGMFDVSTDFRSTTYFTVDFLFGFRF
jgi:hypothetical protein